MVIRQRGLPGATWVSRSSTGLWWDDEHYRRPNGPPQRAKTYTGDILTSLTGWAATLMALMVVQKTGQGQVIDCAQFEAVAQTQGNVLPLYTGQGATYGHTGNRAAGFQPYDTFKCKDAYVFIGAFGGAIYPRVPKFLGLDLKVYNYNECSKDAAALNSRKARNLTGGLGSIAQPVPALKSKQNSIRPRLDARESLAPRTNTPTSTIISGK